MCFVSVGGQRAKIMVASLRSVSSLAYTRLGMGSKGQLELTIIIVQTSAFKLGLQIWCFRFVRFQGWLADLVASLRSLSRLQEALGVSKTLGV